MFGCAVWIWCGERWFPGLFTLRFRKKTSINTVWWIRKAIQCLTHPFLFWHLSPLTWKGITNSTFSWRPRAPSRDICKYIKKAAFQMPKNCAKYKFHWRKCLGIDVVRLFALFFGKMLLVPSATSQPWGLGLYLLELFFSGKIRLLRNCHNPLLKSQRLNVL